MSDYSDNEYDINDEDRDDEDRDDEDRYDEDRDEEYTDEVEYRPSVKDVERVSRGNILDNIVTDKFDRNPYTDFVVRVNAISLDLNSFDNFTNKLKDSDIKEMIEYAANIHNIQYKNPTAYILGYIATNGGKNIDKKKVDYLIKNVLDITMDRSSVTPPDIIRYSRFWLNFKK
uniref:Uncharacterized protein n=1 Tax=viral metagenome TaxID=1070528 RepID=A0A6C0CZN2_9ZZZZ